MSVELADTLVHALVMAFEVVVVATAIATTLSAWRIVAVLLIPALKEQPQVSDGGACMQPAIVTRPTGVPAAGRRHARDGLTYARHRRRY